LKQVRTKRKLQQKNQKLPTCRILNTEAINYSDNIRVFFIKERKKTGNV
jgi:hypothetical protein